MNTLEFDMEYISIMDRITKLERHMKDIRERERSVIDTFFLMSYRGQGIHRYDDDFYLLRKKIQEKVDRVIRELNELDNITTSLWYYNQPDNYDEFFDIEEKLSKAA